LRFDWNSGFGTFFSPSLGLIWRINPLLKLRTQLGRAFRAPTLNDLYWPIYGNPNIKPEIGNAYQIGLDYNPNSILSLSTTLFARRTKNLITWSPDSTGFWRPGNVDSSSIFGFEFTGKIKLTDEISFQLSGTLQDAQQIRKEIIYDDWFTGTTEFIYQKRKQTNTPNINFSPSVNIENRLGTNINIYGRYSSSRYNYYTSYDSLPRISMQTKKLPAYFILSLHIAQKLTNLINLKLKIDNLYDVKYSEQFGNSIIDKDYPRPGRIVFIGFEIKN
jgi:outer membrane cobalamin receptor